MDASMTHVTWEPLAPRSRWKGLQYTPVPQDPRPLTKFVQIPRRPTHLKATSTSHNFNPEMKLGHLYSFYKERSYLYQVFLNWWTLMKLGDHCTVFYPLASLLSFLIPLKPSLKFLSFPLIPLLPLCKRTELAWVGVEWLSFPGWLQLMGFLENRTFSTKPGTTNWLVGHLRENGCLSTVLDGASYWGNDTFSSLLY